LDDERVSLLYNTCLRFDKKLLAYQ
jgi:hypothetical protein